MAYWAPETAFGDSGPGGRVAAMLVKLHGSIDWHAEPNGSVIRCREGCGYPERAGNVLIYPQATKYVATQRDPFAAQFERLRSALRSPMPTVLAVCGYSFGDDHVDLQIEDAMSRPDCKTVIIVFAEEKSVDGAYVLPNKLKHWLDHASWSSRLFALTSRGVYHGSSNNLCSDNRNYNWWTFEGATKFLGNGPRHEEANAKEPADEAANVAGSEVGGA